MRKWSSKAGTALDRGACPESLASGEAPDSISLIISTCIAVSHLREPLETDHGTCQFPRPKSLDWAIFFESQGGGFPQWRKMAWEVVLISSLVMGNVLGPKGFAGLNPPQQPWGTPHV